MVYERLTINKSDTYISEVRGLARWFSCMQIVFVRMRFKLATDLEADKRYTIGTFTGNPPSLYTPLNMHIGTSGTKKGTAAVEAGSGELLISSESSVSRGTYIYISGFYYSYKGTEEGD